MKNNTELDVDALLDGCQSLQEIKDCAAGRGRFYLAREERYLTAEEEVALTAAALRRLEMWAGEVAVVIVVGHDADHLR